MIFDAVVYKLDNCIIFKILSSDLSDIHNEKYYYNTDTFFIKRQNSLSLRESGIFLPGDRDYQTPHPRCQSLWFLNALKFQEWIERYQIAYREVNKCEPLIIDIEELGLSTEYAPDVRLA